MSATINSKQSFTHPQTQSKTSLESETWVLYYITYYLPTLLALTTPSIKSDSNTGIPRSGITDFKATDFTFSTQICKEIHLQLFLIPAAESLAGKILAIFQSPF